MRDSFVNGRKNINLFYKIPPRPCSCSNTFNKNVFGWRVCSYW